MERHGNLLKTSVDEYTKVTSDVLAAGSFEESATKQADAARYGYDSTVARLRELGDIATRANVAAVDILNARITEAFDELKALFAAPVDPSAASPPVIGEPVADAEETARGGHADASVEPEPSDTATPRTARSTAGPGVRTGRRPTSKLSKDRVTTAASLCPLRRRHEESSSTIAGLSLLHCAVGQPATKLTVVH